MKIAVIGAGYMGSGITQICAKHGISVIMWDVNEGMLNVWLENIQSSLKRKVIKKEYQVRKQKERLS